jgi:aryl sulfotransferase
MTRRFWLASYPKSGNTWFRMLVASLRRQAPLNINVLPEADGIASARRWFDNVMLFPAGLLTHEECDRLRPRIYQTPPDDAADEDENRTTQLPGLRFVKTHDAYTDTIADEPLLGGSRGAAGVILIVRDPRDIAPSLAHHNRQGIDAAIDLMGRADAAFCEKRDRQSPQLRQQLLRWSDHVASWLDQRDIPLHLVRYEDIHADAERELVRAMRFAGIEASAADAALAAHSADFSALREQERVNGFHESPWRGNDRPFFRKGISGGWRAELTLPQVRRVERDHAGMMARLGYSRANQDEEAET